MGISAELFIGSRENETRRVTMSDTPDLWTLSDEEIAEELGRAGWCREAPGASRMEQEMALMQEALRRILKRLIAEDKEKKQI